jgi:tetratricopeptide (TPR) repeat protein
MLLGLIIASAGGLFHQSPAIAEVSPSQTLTGRQLLQIGEVHDKQRHFQEALNYYQLALSAFQERRQIRGVADASVKIAGVHEGRGSLEAAYRTLKNAVPLYTRSADSLARARALQLFGRLSARLGYLEEARASYREALSRFATAKERREWTEAAVRLGLLLVGSDSPQEGLALLQKARDEAQSRQDQEQALSTLTALGTALWLMDRQSDAHRYYDEAVVLSGKERNVPVEALLRLRLAYLLNEEGRTAEAVQLGKRALILSQTLRDVESEAAAFTLLAELYRELNQPAEMADSQDHALALYRTRTLSVHGGR